PAEKVFEGVIEGGIDADDHRLGSPQGETQATWGRYPKCGVESSDSGAGKARPPCSTASAIDRMIHATANLDSWPHFLSRRQACHGTFLSILGFSFLPHGAPLRSLPGSHVGRWYSHHGIRARPSGCRPAEGENI